MSLCGSGFTLPSFTRAPSAQQQVSPVTLTDFFTLSLAYFETCCDWEAFSTRTNVMGHDPPWHPASSTCVCLVAQSYLALCDPLDYSPPGSSVHGIFQARMLEWVAISCAGRSYWPRNWTRISCVSDTGRQILDHLWQLGNPYVFYGFPICLF